LEEKKGSEIELAGDIGMEYGDEVEDREV